MRRPSSAKSRVLSLGATFALLLIPLSDLRADDGTPAIPSKDFGTAARHTIIRVVNGDTVIVRIDGKSHRIGLFGIQAPPRSKPLGREARRFLDNLLKGETAYIEYPTEQPETDKFGRRPAYLYRAPDGLFVNLELVRQGYAQVAGELAFEHKELFEHYARKAKQHKKGQWGTSSHDRGQEADAIPAATDRNERDEQARSGENAEFYVTPSGTRYHRADCYHLRKNRVPISLAEARRRGYKPCSHCKPPK